MLTLWPVDCVVETPWNFSVDFLVLFLQQAMRDSPQNFHRKFRSVFISKSCVQCQVLAEVLLFRLAHFLNISRCRLLLGVVLVQCCNHWCPDALLVVGYGTVNTGLPAKQEGAQPYMTSLQDLFQGGVNDELHIVN